MMQPIHLEGMVCFLVRVRNGAKEVALARKKDGKWPYENGYGGKCKPRQTIVGCAIEEVEEESGVKVTPTDLIYRGCIDFYYREELFGKGQGTNFRNHIFLCETWSGEVQETQEMSAPVWYPITCLPVDRMWPANRHWLKQVFLEGKSVYGEVYHDRGQKVVDVKLKFE